MLTELRIENFAIIQELELTFQPGLTTFTGETGAGKSIIVDAMALLLGGRGSTEVIRTGCAMASIEGVFLPSPALQDTLRPLVEDLGLQHEGDELILRRDISRQRRSACRVNGYNVPLTALQEIGAHLVDIHGQGAHLSLLQPRNHIDLVDRFGALMPQRLALAEKVRELRRVRADLRALQRDERELARRVDLLSYQIDEIRAARLKPVPAGSQPLSGYTGEARDGKPLSLDQRLGGDRQCGGLGQVKRERFERMELPHIRLKHRFSARRHLEPPGGTKLAVGHLGHKLHGGHGVATPHRRIQAVIGATLMDSILIV